VQFSACILFRTSEHDLPASLHCEPVSVSPTHWHTPKSLTGCISDTGVIVGDGALGSFMLGGLVGGAVGLGAACALPNVCVP
jgi:hypothetical protein